MKIAQTIMDTAGGMVGNIEKAIVEVIDCREQTVVREEAVSAAGGKAASLPLGNSKLFNKTFSKLENKGFMEDNPVPAGGTRKFFYVQFNPAEISLSGYGGGLMQITNYARNSQKEGQNSMNYEAMKMRITMDVKLIFDKVNVKDAFMAERFSTAPTSATTGLVQLGMKAAGKADYSVQKEVEGFIAALRSPHTRKINFYWGDMFYGGILYRISSRYTMFNPQGEPVRGEVQLSITCADEEVQETSMGRWQKQYQKAFQNQNQSFVKKAQKVGNLFNFNL